LSRDYLAEVAAIDGRIGLANFARVLARCETMLAEDGSACPIGGCG
jgi:hypothetical protein